MITDAAGHIRAWICCEFEKWEKTGKENEMAEQLNEEIKALLQDKETIKAVATISPEGIPHVVYKGSLHADAAGNLVIYEILESSANNRNLVYSIWYDKKVAVNLLGKNGESYEIVGKPLRSITAGKEFEATYEAVRQRLGDVDLGAVWIIEPVQIKNETFAVRVEEDEKKYPILKHLDRV